jgi:hypothetical protein
MTRSVIGGLGSSSFNNDILLQSTIGQPAIIGTEKHLNGLVLRQGFQQSYSIDPAGMENLTITLFPNPNNGSFQFFTDLNSDTPYQFEITDARGRVILNGSAKGSEYNHLDIMQMANSIYYLNIRTTKGSGFFKIIKTI